MTESANDNVDKVVNNNTRVNRIVLDDNTKGNVLYVDGTGTINKLPVGTTDGDILTTDLTVGNKLSYKATVTGVVTNSTIIALGNLRFNSGGGYSYTIFDPHTLDDGPPYNYIEGFYMYYPAVIKKLTIWPIRNDQWPSTGVDITLELGRLTDINGGDPNGQPYVNGNVDGSVFVPYTVGTGLTLSVGPGNPILGTWGGVHVDSDVQVSENDYLTVRCQNNGTTSNVWFGVAMWLQRLYF
jgi:hypothetical protein